MAADRATQKQEGKVPTTAPPPGKDGAGLRISLKDQHDALRDGKLLGFECSTCKTRRLTPMAICPNGHDTVAPKEFRTEGVVETYTIQHISSEAFMNEVPFAWVIVMLDEGGPRVSGWVPFVAKAADLPRRQRVRFTPSYKPGMMFEKV